MIQICSCLPRNVVRVIHVNCGYHSQRKSICFIKKSFFRDYRQLFYTYSDKMELRSLYKKNRKKENPD